MSTPITGCKNFTRDHCIITIFLNYALRLSELASLNLNQVNNDILSVVSKGNKERKIFLTPAAKKSINNWLHIRNSMNVTSNALFISRNNDRITTSAVQNIVKKYGRVDIRSLQQILGHESIPTTEIYTHIDLHQLQSAVNSNPLAMMFN
ncbi:tyrosine-type recombinase/integrase [Clostridium estertheticum]|uniref:tyrosine-type recombinase/integrase n=1 Tax=Clostridium estertheticum TaxID=238834 RepID=UPI0028149FB9|nr:tyrosine-type recombinase/integrase [Clostridium estertheticum]